MKLVEGCAKANSTFVVRSVQLSRFSLPSRKPVIPIHHGACLIFLILKDFTLVVSICSYLAKDVIDCAN
jgi:hypothetical protein